MFAIFGFLDLVAKLAQAFLGFSQAVFSFFLCGFQSVTNFNFTGQLNFECLDFALALQHPMQFRLRTVEQ